MLRLPSDADVSGDIVRGLRQRLPEGAVRRVQDVGLDHTPDPDVLAWAAANGRAVFTCDRNTMTGHAWDRVREGQKMLGVFVLPQNMAVGPAVLELQMIAEASGPADWINRVEFLPL